MKKAIEKIKEFGRFGSVLGLERMNELLELLGNPQEDLKVIHVAGTNGKGSACKFIYEVLQANGYKVGLYTSPFVEFFNERIEYDGNYISNEDLEKCTEIVLDKVKIMVDEGSDSPTEFEVITAIAVVYFKMKNSDFVVLEVGLGGRGDSTNITDKPIVSVITSISYDHMDRLGNTLEEIAYDKAGIIKSGVPVVSGVEAKEAAKVIAKEAYKKKCILHDATKLRWEREAYNGNGSCFSAEIDGTLYKDIEISMKGEHQIANALCSLTAIEIMRKSSIIEVDYANLKKGMKKAFQKGRFEIIKGASTYVLDGAHNQEGMEALVLTMDECFYNKKTLTVIGVLRDKAVEDILDKAVFLGDDFIVTEPDNPRKLPADDLARRIEKRGKKSHIAKNRKCALSMVKEMEEEYDVVLFAGSLYLIGEFRRLITNDDRMQKENTVIL